MTSPVMDPQDPLPDPSMGWRRGLTFLATICIQLILAAGLVLAPAKDVLAYAQSVMVLQAIVWILYFGGASSSDLVRLFGALRPRLGVPIRRGAK